MIKLKKNSNISKVVRNEQSVPKKPGYKQKNKSLLLAHFKHPMTTRYNGPLGMRGPQV